MKKEGTIKYLTIEVIAYVTDYYLELA